MSAFLRGQRAALHAPGTDGRASAPMGPQAWLDPGPAAPGIDEIMMEVRPLAQGEAAATAGKAKPVALVGLTTIDWIERTARLCAGPVSGGGPEGKVDPALLQDALDLVVRYARDELGLERVEAAPTAGTPPGMLDALGFPAPNGEAGGAVRVRAFPDPLRSR